MQKISRITFKNFKFFYGEQSIELNRKNLLLYGENGSGKSSIYWGLYTFLQSVLKPNAQQVQKYFNKSDQSLKNRFSSDADDSYIEIDFVDKMDSRNTKKVSNTTVNTKAGSIVKSAVIGSDFLNYKLLSKLYDFKNSEDIDLFPLLDNDSLVFVTFREALVKQDGNVGSNNAQEWWNYLSPGPNPRSKMHEVPYKQFKLAVDKFNLEFNFYLNRITESVNEYLKLFEQPFSLSFNYMNVCLDPFEPGSTTKRRRGVFPPGVLLRIKYNNTNIATDKQQLSRPHTFLNEAKLTTIALSIRFAMIDEKLNTSSLVDEDSCNLLVLDDLLISLDMSNRDKVLNIILSNFQNYQMLIFTHDKHFFELTKHKIGRTETSDNWKFLEMYECEKEGIPQPLLMDSKSYLEKAEYYFYKKEYEVAGNFLRKEAELFCQEFLPRKLHFTSDFMLQTLNGLITASKEYARSNGIETTLFEALDGHRKFVLNPTSHDSYDVPKYNSEVGDCLQTMKELRKIKFDKIFNKGDQLEFELICASNSQKYKFDISIEDSFRLIKVEGHDSVLTKGMINYWVTIDGLKGKRQSTNTSLQAFYKKNYDKSNKVLSNNFWEGIIFSLNRNPISINRKF
jgi:hypothetical protein